MTTINERLGSAGNQNLSTYSSADIADWNVEDNAFWESKGKGPAYRNLWI